MTVEEKSREIFQVQEYMECENASDEMYMKKDAFTRGAEWMLEKAMALIEDSVVFDKFGRPVKSETFRKALEE